MAADAFNRPLERQLDMAAPRFFMPPRVSSSRPKRRFSLQQANRTLPLVSRIVADIVAVHKNAADLQLRLEQIPAGSRDRAEVERDLQASLGRLQSLLDELSDVGCEMKDFQLGLVDFVSRYQGRDIYLCWRLGESQISYWHELDAGYAGRQPVSLLGEGQ